MEVPHALPPGAISPEPASGGLVSSLSSHPAPESPARPQIRASSTRMRNFFLGDTFLTSCGTRQGGIEGGYSYFCPGCGKIWGRVDLGCKDWLPVTIPCVNHGRPEWGVPFRGGSFLAPLIWWDFANGNTLALQLAQASYELLYYEASIRVKRE